MTEPTEVDKTSLTDSLKQESIEQAMKLAPWRSGLPWWVVLVEGIVLIIIGILVLIDPRKSTLNIALFLSAAMMIAGVFQLWAVFRGKAPESVDSLIAARGAIAVFSGGIILLLRFLEYVQPQAGLLIFGLGSITYGVSGFVVAYKAKASRRRSGLVEGLFFTLFGALLLYILIAGPEAGQQIQNFTSIVAWVAIIGGLALGALSFFNYRKQKQAQEMEAQLKDAMDDAGVSATETKQMEEQRPAEDAQTLETPADEKRGYPQTEPNRTTTELSPGGTADPKADARSKSDSTPSGS